MMPETINLTNIFVYLLIINIFSFVLFAVDKRRSQKGGWRIEERNLLLSALLGGSLGAWLGMYILHHKTRHIKFYMGLPLIILVQAILIIYCLRLQ